MLDIGNGSVKIIIWDEHGADYGDTGYYWILLANNK